MERNLTALQALDAARRELDMDNSSVNGRSLIMSEVIETDLAKYIAEKILKQPKRTIGPDDRLISSGPDRFVSSGGPGAVCGGNVPGAAGRHRIERPDLRHPGRAGGDHPRPADAAVTTFFHRLRELYENSPDPTAIHWMDPRLPEHPISYRELICGAAGYAGALQDAGVQPGEVVVLILQHSEALVFSFFGAILHGAVPAIMPFLTEKLSPETYRRSLKSLFEVTAPAAVVTYPEFLAEVQSAISPGGSVRKVLLSTEVAPQPEPDFSAMRGRERAPDDVVLLQHSSGTTGLQKGVALSHAAVFRQLDSYADAIRLRPDDTIVSWLPLYHDMGLIAGFIMPVLRGIPWC